MYVQFRGKFWRIYGPERPAQAVWPSCLVSRLAGGLAGGLQGRLPPGASPCRLSNADSLQGGIPKPFGQLVCQVGLAPGHPHRAHAACGLPEFLVMHPYVYARHDAASTRPAQGHSIRAKNNTPPQRAKRAARHALAAPKKSKRASSQTLTALAKARPC